MSILLGKYSLLIPAVLLLAVLAAWQAPLARFIFLMLLLVFSVVRALASVLARGRAARLRGSVTRSAFLRKVFFEIIFVLCVMALAGVGGWYAAQVIAGPLEEGFPRFAAGLLTGLLAGVAVFIAAHPLWRRLMSWSWE